MKRKQSPIKKNYPKDSKYLLTCPPLLSKLRSSNPDSLFLIFKDGVSTYSSINSEIQAL